MMYTLANELSQSLEEDFRQISTITLIIMAYQWYNNVGMFITLMPIRYILRMIICWYFNIEKRKRFIQIDSLTRSTKNLYNTIQDIPIPTILFDQESLDIFLTNEKAEKILKGKYEGEHGFNVQSLFERSEMEELLKDIDKIMDKKHHDNFSKEKEVHIKIGEEDNYMKEEYTISMWKSSWKDRPAIGMK